MKKVVILALAVAVIGAACSSKKSESSGFAKGTPAYQLAKDLSAILPICDPEQNAVLIKTRSFEVKVGDVLEIIHGTNGVRADALKKATAEQLKQTLTNSAVQVAERRLLMAAAVEAGISVSPEEVAAAMKEQYDSAGGEEKYLEILKTNDIKLDFVKKTVQDDQLIKKYLTNHLFAGVAVSEEEIKKAYGEDKTVSVRHVLLLTEGKKDPEKAEIRKKLEGLLARARKGEDFAKLAKEFSEDPGSKENGGLYEDKPRGTFVKPFEDAAFNVPVGQISDIVETTYGYHILKIENRKKESAPLEEIRARIENQIKDTKKVPIYQDAVEKLKRTAEFVEVKF
jgi:parvulin-like peptidyl-prolyl isomerase